MRIQRRTFLATTAATGVLDLHSFCDAADDEKLTLTPAQQQRLACTTVCFRNWFPATRAAGISDDAQTISIHDVPDFFVRELGVHQVELWSKHVPSTDEEAFRGLARSASLAGARILNIQLDERDYSVKGESGAEVQGLFNLSDASQLQRSRSVTFAKRWMDLAIQCGASSLRANTGKTAGRPFEMGPTADSFRQLAEYGQQIGIKILVENHGPNVAEPQRLAELVRRVDHPDCRTLPDFGNVPKQAAESFRQKMLHALVPTAHLVSAKTQAFDVNGMHTAYDFETCVKLCEQLGYRGVYSAEYWNPTQEPFDSLAIARRTLRMIAKHLRSDE